ncbi:MAG: hypothetical protein QXS68_07965 [Candidatus Methanomethylicaceae archaeon]
MSETHLPLGDDSWEPENNPVRPEEVFPAPTYRPRKLHRVIFRTLCESKKNLKNLKQLYAYSWLQGGTILGAQKWLWQRFNLRPIGAIWPNAQKCCMSKDGKVGRWYWLDPIGTILRKKLKVKKTYYNAEKNKVPHLFYLPFRVLYSGFWTPRWKWSNPNSYRARLYLCTQWGMEDLVRDLKTWKECPEISEYLIGGKKGYSQLVLWDFEPKIRFLGEEPKDPGGEDA